MNVIQFICAAIWYRVAYIDLDGCLLYRWRLPTTVAKNDALSFWQANLPALPIVEERLALCYLLKIFGVRLVVWTNRAPYHDDVTRESLGRHCTIFDEFQYHNGLKDEAIMDGPIMDDQEKYVACGTGWGLLVDQK